MMRNVKKIQLPPNFAQKLLDCQIEYKLSDVPSKQIVKSLVQLYSIGVEYYQSIRSHKYLYFQLKMNQIFTTAATMTAINEQQPVEVQSPLKKKMKSVHQQERIHALQIKQKQEKMFQQVAENTTQSATVVTVKKMINQNDLKTLQASEKVKKQIQNQDVKLRQKLQKRKSRILFSKSFSSAGLMNEDETQDTLFTQVIPNDLKIDYKQKIQLKPIEVSFGSIIKENQSDQQQVQKVSRRRMSISQDPSKKARIQIQSSLKNAHKQ